MPMNSLPLFFRITGIAIGIQLVLGGLLTFDFISPAPHIIFGFVVFLLAIITLIISFMVKPGFKPAKMMSVGLVILLVIQIALGFWSLDTNNALVAFFHFLNALLIFGLAVSGTVIIAMWNRTGAQTLSGAKKEKTKTQVD